MIGLVVDITSVFSKFVVCVLRMSKCVNTASLPPHRQPHVIVVQVWLAYARSYSVSIRAHALFVCARLTQCVRW
eukprot:COSAG06_NODE_784_length_12328_cov_4.921416_3_plen_74_part_00